MMSVKEKTVGVRMTNELVQAVKKDADRSGLTVSEQIRFELSVRRGMWRPPVLPDGTHPSQPRRANPK